MYNIIILVLKVLPIFIVITAAVAILAVQFFVNNPLLGVARVSGDRVVSFFRRLNHHYPADLGPGLFSHHVLFSRELHAWT